MSRVRVPVMRDAIRRYMILRLYEAMDDIYFRRMPASASQSFEMQRLFYAKNRHGYHFKIYRRFASYARNLPPLSF